MSPRHETEASKKNYVSVEEAMRLIGCGRTLASNYLRSMNRELADQGFMIARGRVPRKYFMRRMGLSEETVDTRPLPQK